MNTSVDHWTLPFLILNCFIIHLNGSPLLTSQGELNKVVLKGSHLELPCLTESFTSPDALFQWKKDGALLISTRNPIESQLHQQQQSTSSSSPSLSFSGPLRPSLLSSSSLSLLSSVSISSADSAATVTGSSKSTVTGKLITTGVKPLITATTLPTTATTVSTEETIIATTTKPRSTIRTFLTTTSDHRISISSLNGSLIITNVTYKDEGLYLCEAFNYFETALLRITLYVIESHPRHHRYHSYISRPYHNQQENVAYLPILCISIVISLFLIVNCYKKESSPDIPDLTETSIVSNFFSRACEGHQSLLLSKTSSTPVSSVNRKGGLPSTAKSLSHSPSSTRVTTLPSTCTTTATTTTAATAVITTTASIESPLNQPKRPSPQSCHQLASTSGFVQFNRLSSSSPSTSLSNQLISQKTCLDNYNTFALAHFVSNNNNNKINSNFQKDENQLKEQTTSKPETLIDSYNNNKQFNITSNPICIGQEINRKPSDESNEDDDEGIKRIGYLSHHGPTSSPSSSSSSSSSPTITTTAFHPPFQHEQSDHHQRSRITYFDSMVVYHLETGDIRDFTSKKGSFVS